MALNQTKFRAGEEDPGPISISVMPRGDYGGKPNHTTMERPEPDPVPSKPAPANPGPAAPNAPMSTPPGIPTNPLDTGVGAGADPGSGNGHGLPVDHDTPGFWQRKSTYWVLGILLLVILGAGAYVLLGPQMSGTDEPDQPATRLPSTFTQQYFGVAECSDTATCGDESNPDDDGLTNYQEFVEGTSPIQPDTDFDGLADGDEVNIYKTDPNDKFTDKRQVVQDNGYLDGIQVANGFDPLTPGLQMNQARLAQIADDTAQYGLHEPTQTTLATVSEQSPVPKTVTVFISAGQFDDPSVEVNVGDTVVWLNQDEEARQIASDPHPAHTDLPDLVSSELAQNQTYSYKFMVPGTYGYHDHLNPTAQGTVIVK